MHVIIDDSETRRYRRNWIVIHTTSFLMMLTNTIVLSSQHQFVTNPRHPEDPNVRSAAQYILAVNITSYSSHVNHTTVLEGSAYP